MITVGIIGYGFVGKAVATLKLISPVVIYDKYIDEYKDTLKEVIEQDIVFVCVSTNSTTNGRLDISGVLEVAQAWETRTNRESILVIKSTVPVGTTDNLRMKLKSNRILFNPEFLSQRTAFNDFFHADEVIIGGNEECIDKLEQLYKTILPNNAIYKRVPADTAELIKITRNSYYAVKVGFMNDIYDLCEKLGIDYNVFRKNYVGEGIGSWINPQHTLVPGPDNKRGFGGACLPKDSLELYNILKDNELDAGILEQVIKANQNRRK